MATLAEAPEMTTLPFTRIPHPAPVATAARDAALADLATDWLVRNAFNPTQSRSS